MLKYKHLLEESIHKIEYLTPMSELMLKRQMYNIIRNEYVESTGETITLDDFGVTFYYRKRGLSRCIVMYDTIAEQFLFHSNNEVQKDYKEYQDMLNSVRWYDLENADVFMYLNKMWVAYLSRNKSDFDIACKAVKKAISDVCKANNIAVDEHLIELPVMFEYICPADEMPPLQVRGFPSKKTENGFVNKIPMLAYIVNANERIKEHGFKAFQNFAETYHTDIRFALS